MIYMIKLKNGNLRTVIYNENDLAGYISAGWSLVEEEKPKQVNVETKEKIDEKNNRKGKSIKK